MSRSGYKQKRYRKPTAEDHRANARDLHDAINALANVTMRIFDCYPDGPLRKEVARLSDMLTSAKLTLEKQAYKDCPGLRAIDIYCDPSLRRKPKQRENIQNWWTERQVQIQTEIKPTQLASLVASGKIKAVETHRGTIVYCPQDAIAISDQEGGSDDTE